MEKWLSDNAGFLPSAVNIGFVKIEKRVYLIDTGIDNSSVNKAIKIFGEVSGAMITHHHADHMGGLNKLEKLGITQLFAPPRELDFIRQPLNEPYSMFGGGYPPKLLRNRHLEARPCKSIRSCTEQTLVRPVSTPGHTIDHHTYLFGDYFFTGDAAFTSNTIEKYKLLFAIDPKSAADSAEMMKSLKFEVMIPGHGPIQEQRADALEVLDITIEHYKTTKEMVLQLVGEKLLLDNYLSHAMNELGLKTIIKERGFTQYILYQVPLMGYLSNILDEKKVEINMEKEGPTLWAQ